MSDRQQVFEMLEEFRMFGRLTYPGWRLLGDIVDRNQNDGVFTEPEWTALRDWYRASQAAQHAQAVAANVFRVA